MKLSLQGPSGLVCSMTIKDEMLFAGTADGRIMAWKFPAKEINSEPVSILAGHDRHVISLAVSATRLYSGSLDKTIRVRKCCRPADFCWLLNIMFVSDIFLVFIRYGTLKIFSVSKHSLSIKLLLLLCFVGIRSYYLALWIRP